MHELSVFQSLLTEVEAQVAAVTAPTVGVVTRLELDVGRLSGINAEALRFAFEVLSEGTCVEGAVLEIDQPPVERRCLSCRATTESEDLLAGCPRCGSDEVRFDGSRDLILHSLELREDRDPGRRETG